MMSLEMALDTDAPGGLLGESLRCGPDDLRLSESFLTSDLPFGDRSLILRATQTWEDVGFQRIVRRPLDHSAPFGAATNR